MEVIIEIDDGWLVIVMIKHVSYTTWFICDHSLNSASRMGAKD